MTESLPLPLIVSVREARRLLGGASNNRFWKIVGAGELELLGSERKRWVTVASIQAYIQRQVAGAAAAPRRRGLLPRQPHRQPHATTG
jgi:hypothetical protein